MRPRFLPSAPLATLHATLLIILFEVTFIVASAQLFGVTTAVVSAWSWITETK